MIAGNGILVWDLGCFSTVSTVDYKLVLQREIALIFARVSPPKIARTWLSYHERVYTPVLV